MLRCIFCLLLTTVLCATAQQVSRLSSQESTPLLLEKAEPIYPALAKAAKIQGSVQLELTVSESGTVSNVKLIRGHPLLVAAAVDAAKRWKYRPYLVNGVATGFVTNIEIPFSLEGSAKEQANDQAATDGYFALEKNCREPIKQQRWTEAETPCRAALDAAIQSGMSGLTLQGAYQHLGYSLLYQKKFDKASDLFAKALEIGLRVSKETDAELGYAYRDVGMAAHGLGDVVKAEEFYTKAEKTFELARGHIGDEEMAARYTRALKTVLGYHLMLAKEAGQQKEQAAIELKLRQEAQ